VPGTLEVVATVPRGTREQDHSGFLVLSRGSQRLRIPFWFRVERPRLPLDRHIRLDRTGVYSASTLRGAARVTGYRYPDVPSDGAIPVRLRGRELVYRVRIRGRPANFGVAVTARNRGVRVEPRIVRAGDENRLAGYAGLPLDLNPYRDGYGEHRLVAGVVLPAPGVYDIVFDTPVPGQEGAFRFRFWRNDTRPPSARVLGVRGRFLELAVRDGGSGIDPTSIEARINDSRVRVAYAAGRARISLAGIARGRHTLTFTVADYQETKNMEDVARILPNTRVLRTAFRAP